MAASVLKVQIESNNENLSNESILYIKSNILNYYFNDKDIEIIKSISEILNSFLQTFGIEIYPSIISILIDNLNNKNRIEIVLDTLNIILEDFRDILVSKKYIKSVYKILDKILFCLQINNIKNIDNNLINKLLYTLNIFFDNYQEFIKENMREIIPIINLFSDTDNDNIKTKIAKIWYTLIHLDKLLVFQHYEDLFNFFISLFNEKNYEQSFISAQFFLYIISNEENFKKDENVKNSLKNKLNVLLPIILKNMVLNEKDINYLDNKFQDELVIHSISNSSSIASNSVSSSLLNFDGPNSNTNTSSNTNSNNSNNNTHSNSNNSGNGSSGSSGSSNNNSNNNSSGSNSDYTNDNSSSNDYNPDLTLRKCCSRVLDNLSLIFPQETFNIIRPFFENEIQSEDDLIKERSILAFGAIAQGSYLQVISYLNNVIPFLITELQHPNKYVRAITCWTLSKYTKFILIDNYSENKNELFKEYLTEILKKILDKESIVRESACGAFQEIILTDKTFVETYLFDVFKVIVSVFDKYTGSNLLSIYDILLVIMENYSTVFQNQNFVDEIIKCLLQKWYDLVKNNDTLTLPYFFEVILNLIKVSGSFFEIYCDYFLIGCLKIIEVNVNELKISNYSEVNIDKELLIRSIDTISALCQYFPDYIKNTPIRKNIVDFLFEIIKIKDIYLKNYVIICFGDLIKIDYLIFKNKINQLYDFLIPLITYNTNNNPNNNNLKNNNNSDNDNHNSSENNNNNNNDENKNNIDNKIYNDNNNLNNNINNNKIIELDEEKISICNNAIWTIILILEYYPEESFKYIDSIYIQLEQILNISNIYNMQIGQNISICIGRLSLINPKKMSNKLKNFFHFFCKSLIKINNSDEKYYSFLGICKCILYNPNDSYKNFDEFFEVVINYENSKEELEKLFREIINSYSISYKDKFKDIISNYSNEIQIKIKHRFNIN